MNEAVRWFIEEVGLRAEADGLPRIAGRLFGFLLLSPGPCSLDEIAEALGVSKGSVSTDARLLLRHGWLRRVSLPGDRRDYYEMAPDFFGGIVAYRLARWEALHDLVAEARHRLPRQPDAVRERMRYLDEAQHFFVAGIRKLLAEWDEQRAAAGAATLASSSARRQEP
ncbi:MAG: MarR family transcriptional regulator [Gemmatimonadaceae bacterium]|nr:MarR family transcriptional regulator [Gemmatimonadaceae bacterium]